MYNREVHNSLTAAEKAKAEQNLFLNKSALDVLLIDGPDFTNTHDLNRQVGKVLSQLELEGKIKRSSTDFDFSKAVSKLRYEINKSENGKVKMWRDAALYFATLADAFRVIEG